MRHMSKSTELLEIAKTHLYGNYNPAAFVVERGQGCDLFDVDGRRCLDLAAGVAVSAVGHAHPVLVRAIAEQAAKVVHASNYYYNEPNIRLAAGAVRARVTTARFSATRVRRQTKRCSSSHAGTSGPAATN